MIALGLNAKFPLAHRPWATKATYPACHLELGRYLPRYLVLKCVSTKVVRGLTARAPRTLGTVAPCQESRILAVAFYSDNGNSTEFLLPQRPASDLSPYRSGLDGTGL